MLKFDNIRAAYCKNTVLDGVSFELRPHTLTAVVGRNGCGKSTLVGCVNSQVKYTGEISFSGRSLALMTRAEIARCVAILPQLLLSPHITVRELIGYGRSPYLPLGARFSFEDKRAVDEAAQITGVYKLMSKYVDCLSGGERQKAYLAMVLAQDTRVLVLDEPAAFIDVEYENELMKTLQTLAHKREKTLLLVTHNLSAAVRFADNIAVLDAGKLRFFGSPDECIEQNVISEVFNVKTHIFNENGERYIMFT